MKRNSMKEKQNIPYVCEPRPSLRMTMTTKKKSQKGDGRMSVLPLRKQRLSVNVQPQLMTESRPSLRTNINLLNTAMTTPLQSCQRSIRKQTIINNLVNKLDEEQEIRSIIETKLRRNSYGPNKEFMYTSEFQPFSSTSSSLYGTQKNLTLEQFCGNTEIDYSKVTDLSSKLKQTQEELDYFKSIVKDMAKSISLFQSQEMKVLERQTNNSSKAKRFDEIGHNYGEETKRCQNCCSCKCSKDNKMKSSFVKTAPYGGNRLIEVNTQTDYSENEMLHKPQETENYEFDFFDNLDRTLKILSNSKNL